MYIITSTASHSIVLIHVVHNDGENVIVDNMDEYYLRHGCVRIRAWISNSYREMPLKSEYPPVPIPSRPFHEDVLTKIVDHMKNDKIAFICAESNAQVSYSTVHKAAQAVTTFLRKNSFQKDVACMVLPNHWAWAPFFLGVSMNGGALTGINSSATEHELKRQFIDSCAKVVLTDEKSLSNVVRAAHDSNVEGVHCWERDVLNTPCASSAFMTTVDVDKDTVFMPFSSGTTGVPKGVMVTHYNYGFMMNIFREHQKSRMLDALQPPWDESKDKYFFLLPFYHCYGFALLMASILDGHTAVIMSQFQPELFCETIQRHKIRFVCVAPPLLVFLAKSPICDQYDFSSLEFIMSGAAPAGKDICEELRRKYKNLKHIQQGYGMSETTMATHLPDLILGQPFGSVGKLVSNLEMKIIDPETGLEQKHRTPGEVCIRGPTIMRGYFNNVKATADCIEDGWLHTGDIGYVNDEGYLFIVDRLKELIKVKGFQVPPAELEGILLTHPDIQDAAVIGVPDLQNGEVPKAFVVRATDSLNEEHVKAFVAEKVSPYKQLAGGVEFVNSIPKSPAGKILRRLLRDQNSRSRSKL